jgi:hypothetical protein
VHTPLPSSHLSRHRPRCHESEERTAYGVIKPEGQSIYACSLRSLYINKSRKRPIQIAEHTITYGQRAVITRAACDKQKTATSPDLRDVVLESAEQHLIRFEVYTSTHRVHYRFRLFEDLFLHERAKVTYTQQTSK